MKKFDYDKAEADLYDSGCENSEEIFEYTSEKGRDSFMKENGLDPGNYYGGSDEGFGGIGGGMGGGEDNGACYLTTACVRAKRLPDDCDELQTLRGFRDGYLRGRKDGSHDIETYYAVAPRIVAAINAQPEAEETWRSIYSRLVAPCVRLIKDGQNEQAYILYRDYSLGLKEKYLHEK